MAVRSIEARGFSAAPCGSLAMLAAMSRAPKQQLQGGSWDFYTARVYPKRSQLICGAGMHEKL